MYKESEMTDKNKITNRSPGRLFRGFTLVELLVVISVIALLLSILLPSLQKARETAKNIVCMNNQKNISLMLMLYQQDNDYYFPPIWNGKNTWVELIAPYAGEDTKSMLNPDLRFQGYGVLYCPSNMEAVSDIGYPTNYVVNAHIITNVRKAYEPARPWRNKLKRITDFESPKETFILAENAATFKCSPYEIPDLYPHIGVVGLPHRSKTGCNITYVDGHIESIVCHLGQMLPVAVDRDDRKMFR